MDISSLIDNAAKQKQKSGKVSKPEQVEVKPIKKAESMPSLSVYKSTSTSQSLAAAKVVPKEVM